MTSAVDCLGVRGRLCLVAIHPRPREVNLHRFFWRELTLVGARLYDRGDFERAVELVATGAVPAGELVKRAGELAGEIASNAPLAVRAIKRMMRAAETETFEQNVHHVFLQLLPLLNTSDFREGVAAFMEKRPAKFTGS